MASLTEFLGWFAPKEVARKVREGYMLQERTFKDVLSLDDGQFNDFLNSKYLVRETEETLQTPIRIIGMSAYSLFHTLVHLKANSKVSGYIHSQRMPLIN
ncbi:hypothetical protein HYT23_01785 [Candidatus Pacearchaeota archaeon]|nr:hypothetical protein [Candidatus Pacearchaeota archaeon]